MKIKHWYHVRVELPDKRTFLIAIEATSKLNAAVLVAADWGRENLRKVSRSDGTEE